MITEFGKELRKLRVDNEERLLDMAERLGKSAAFVSAVEVGKKSPPTDFEEGIICSYSLQKEMATQLRLLADRARKAFTIEPNSSLGRDTAGMLARCMNELSEEQLTDIQNIVGKRRG